MILMVTGHRPSAFPSGYTGIDDEKQWTIAVIRDVISKVDKLPKLPNLPMITMSGMALGVDQWFAHYALEAGLKLHAVVPFAGQDARWPETARRAYARLLARATTVTILHPDPPANTPEAARWLNDRNRWMVDRTSP